MKMTFFSNTRIKFLKEQILNEIVSMGKKLHKNGRARINSVKYRLGFDSFIYSRNVIDMNWGLVIKLALPAKVTIGEKLGPDDNCIKSKITKFVSVKFGFYEKITKIMTG
jgi:hypothetical protein